MGRWRRYQVASAVVVAASVEVVLLLALVLLVDGHDLLDLGLHRLCHHLLDVGGADRGH